MYSLATLMKQNGHDFIDILKVCCHSFTCVLPQPTDSPYEQVDIEGWEFQTLSALLKQFSSQPSLPFGQLQLEIHAWHHDFPAFLKWWTELEDAGLRPFWTEPNLIYANYNRGGPPHLAEVRLVSVLAGFLLALLTPWRNIVLLHQYQRQSCACFGIVASDALRLCYIPFLKSPRWALGANRYLSTVSAASRSEGGIMIYVYFRIMTSLFLRIQSVKNLLK